MKCEKTSDPSYTKTLVQMQEKMQTLMTSLMEQHNDLLATIAKKDKIDSTYVKLPKIELNMFFSEISYSGVNFGMYFSARLSKNEQLTYLPSK